MTPNPPRRSEPATRPGARRTFSLVAILGCIPYLILKGCWILGLPLGWRDPSVVAAPGFLAGNLPTLLMDAVVVALAIVFVVPRGRRLPGWLLAVPLWVGTGLLLPIPLVMVVSALIAPAVGGGSVVANTVLDDWVPIVVYGGFTVQAVGLFGGFTLYARDRWHRLFSLRMGGRCTGPAAGTLLLVARAGLTVACVVAAAQLIQSFAVGDVDTRRLVIDRVAAVVDATLVVPGALAATALVSTSVRKSRRYWPAMLIAWAGVAVLFAGSLFGLAGQVMAAEGAGDAASGLIDLAGLLGGTMLGLVAAISLASNEEPAVEASTSTDSSTSEVTVTTA